MTVKYQTLPFFMAASTPRGPVSSLTVSSSAMTSRSAFFSSLVEELGVLRAVDEEEERGNTGHNRQHAFNEEHDLPALDAGHLVADVDEPAGQRRAHHLREGLRQVEDGEHFDADLVGEPARRGT